MRYLPVFQRFRENADNFSGIFVFGGAVPCGPAAKTCGHAGEADSWERSGQAGREPRRLPGCRDPVLRFPVSSRGRVGSAAGGVPAPCGSRGRIGRLRLVLVTPAFICRGKRPSGMRLPDGHHVILCVRLSSARNRVGRQVENEGYLRNMARTGMTRSEMSVVMMTAAEASSSATL